jgi:hypothetical protein
MEEELENLPTLEDKKQEFLYGRRIYRARNDSEYHRISASSEWYTYRKYLLQYPGELFYENECWKILTVGCGKRNRKDTLLLYRLVSKQHILRETNNLSNNWRLYRFARDPETGFYYEVDHHEIRYFTDYLDRDEYDKHFAAWHEDSMLKAYKLIKITEDKEDTEEMKCSKGCRPSYCYCKRECDDKNLKYEINEHSMEVDVTVGYRTLSFTLDEAAELASFLMTAKEEIKKKKIAALEAQQDELKKQLESVKNM